MSDPLDRLRDAQVPEATVDLGAIKARARRITRRREVGLGAAAVAVVTIAGIGFLRGPIADVTSDRVAQEQVATATPAEATSKLSAGKREGATGVTTGKAEVPRGSRGATKDEAGSEAAAAPAGSERTPSELEATMVVEKATVGRGSEFTLKVCNTTKGTVTRSFGSAQRYDFVVQQGDDVTWRWSDDRSFAQVTGEERWKPDECKSWTEQWNAMTSSGAPAPPGSYEVIGVMTSSPEERTDPALFCVDIC